MPGIDWVGIVSPGRVNLTGLLDLLQPDRLALTFFALPSSLLEATTVKSQKINAKFAQRFLKNLYDAVNAHDADAVAIQCSEDIEWSDPGAPETLRGREAVRRFHRETLFVAFPDMKVNVIDGPYLSLDGTGLAVRLQLTGTMTGEMSPPGFAPTGRPVSFETAEFSAFQDNLLSRHTVILDMLGVARQIAAAPKADSLGARMGVWLQRIAAHGSRSGGA